MHQSTLLLLSTLLPLAIAQQLADGQIVPFTSKLPACASKCGPLSDVQGACVPPVTSDVDDNCFCSDSRLSSFLQGPSSIQSICTSAAGCSTSDLQSIEDWYAGFCNKAEQNLGGGTSPTSTSSSTPGSKKASGPPSWISMHYRWVIMIVFVFGGILAAWGLGWFFLRRHRRNKERRDAEEAEKAGNAAPVAWGPHQLQATTGGYSDGILDTSPRGGAAMTLPRGHQKDISTVMASPADSTASPAVGAPKPHRGWLLQKARR